MDATGEKGGGHWRDWVTIGKKKTKPWKCGDFDASFHGFLNSKQAGTCLVFLV